jgi:hypothetical protein
MDRRFMENRGYSGTTRTESNLVEAMHIKLPLPNELGPCSRVLFEKLTAPQGSKNEFPAFYGTPMFITVFTTNRPLSLSCVKFIQSTHANPIPFTIRFNITV